ncbi:hypothetical protein RCL_jg23747.t2 [Rhizophagus clarus]|uniref:Uncharacterized protein n=1 Tax=Rhizophagus clarus TaxID=94130 RepID=A0A8H3QS87_9GLOM|nr:hypothetical protein RCL_jg23747.t2 [Rhizophagus clarus]
MKMKRFFFSLLNNGFIFKNFWYIISFLVQIHTIFIGKIAIHLKLITENISLIAQILIITNNKKIIKNDTWRNCKAKFINYLPVAIPRISSNTSPVTGLEKNILKNLKKRETS